MRGVMVVGISRVKRGICDETRRWRNTEGGGQFSVVSALEHTYLGFGVPSRFTSRGELVISASARHSSAAVIVIQRGSSGVAYLTPEIQLLYKARPMRDKIGSISKVLHRVFVRMSAPGFAMRSKCCIPITSGCRFSVIHRCGRAARVRLTNEVIAYRIPAPARPHRCDV
jgi:hypothetical protein